MNLLLYTHLYRNELSTRLQLITTERNRLQTQVFNLDSENSQLHERTKNLQQMFTEVQRDKEKVATDDGKLREIEQERDQQRDGSYRELIKRNEKVSSCGCLILVIYHN